MPMLNKVYSFVLLLISILALTFCGDDGPKLTAEEKVKKILVNGTGTWSPSTTTGAITLDGIDVAADFFPDFTIQFTEDKIFTTGTTPVWLREDTWHFKEGSNATIIIRGMDDEEISIVEVSSTQLKLTLEWDHTTYGDRTGSLPGLYEFTLDK